MKTLSFSCIRSFRALLSGLLITSMTLNMTPSFAATRDPINQPDDKGTQVSGQASTNASRGFETHQEARPTA